MVVAAPMLIATLTAFRRPQAGDFDMTAQQTVLLVGGTGRTGQLVLQQLLGRGISVRVIVRSPQKLPAGTTGEPRLTVVEGNPLSLTNEHLMRQLRGCNAVISCLGHVLSTRGIFGPPRDCLQSESPGPFEAGKEWMVRASLTVDKRRSGESVV